MTCIIMCFFNYLEPLRFVQYYKLVSMMIVLVPELSSFDKEALSLVKPLSNLVVGYPVRPCEVFQIFLYVLDDPISGKLSIRSWQSNS